MKPLLGLILLWSINEFTRQGIEIVNNCTCKTFDGGIYSLMPLRRTDGKPRYIECCNLLLRVFVLLIFLNNGLLQPSCACSPAFFLLRSNCLNARFIPHFLNVGIDPVITFVYG